MSLVRWGLLSLIHDRLNALMEVHLWKPTSSTQPEPLDLRMVDVKLVSFQMQCKCAEACTTPDMEEVTRRWVCIISIDLVPLRRGDY